MIAYDSSVVYDAPSSDRATLTGSPLWNISPKQYVQAAEEHGWKHLGDLHPPTPYGPGPLLQSFEMASGIPVIRIPSYGMVRGEDGRLRHSHLKTFWLLWKAGVKVLLVGGTSGVADFRYGDTKILPGDIVLPWSFETSWMHRGLFGTEFETAWPDHDLLLDNPFCPKLAGMIVQAAQVHVEREEIHRVHTPKDVRVALILPKGITFETDYDILFYQAMSWLISLMQSDRPRVATLHGDCVNPVLSRLMGMHLAYYHMVANVAQGLPMERSIVETLYELYTTNFWKVSLEMEFRLLETMPIPTGESCSCYSCLHKAPEEFSQSMTQAL